MTIFTEYTVLCKDHIDAGDTQFKSVITYNHYLMAWYSYIQLLDIDYTKGYTCRASTLISSMIKDADITKDVEKMKVLQQEIPVIFELVRSLCYYPHTLLSPLLQVLLDKSIAPFTDCNQFQNARDDKDTIFDGNDLSFFPCLPRIRSRGIYDADKKCRQQICTKRTSKHPSLLPGIFTVFCEHGM